MKLVRSILLIVFLISAGFLCGGMIASLTIEQPAGLAGAGVAAFNAIIGGLIGLLLAVILLVKASQRIRLVALFISAIIIFISLFILIRNKKAREARRLNSSISLAAFQYDQGPLGLGMAKPKYYENQKLYFYNPNLEKSVDEHLPLDSLVFERTELGVQIVYAPPWFYPEHMKLDYDILLLKVISTTNDWVQLEANKQSGHSVWLDKNDVDIYFWPEFILSTHSIYPIDTNIQLRTKPLENASTVNMSSDLLIPVEINANWLRVNIVDKNNVVLGTGWLKWRDENRLLIKYNILS